MLHLSHVNVIKLGVSPYLKRKRRPPVNQERLYNGCFSDVRALHVTRDHRRSLVNYIIALVLIFFMIEIQTACRWLEERTARYCFVVSVDGRQQGVNNELSRVELCSQSAPFTWETGVSKETYTCSDCQTSHFLRVSIDELPFQFKVNDAEFTLTKTSLSGGGKDWRLVGSPILKIDVDELLRSKRQ
jgi:hypothetical protein